MTTYHVRYVHKISPRDTDTAADVQLAPEDLHNRRALGRAFRAAGILPAGGRVRHFRFDEGQRIVAFPMDSVWHSIVLTLSPTSPPKTFQEWADSHGFTEAEIKMGSRYEPKK